jgi:hypothetical protein
MGMGSLLREMKIFRNKTEVADAQHCACDKASYAHYMSFTLSHINKKNLVEM